MFWYLIWCRNQRIIDTVDLDTPTWERETTGFWIDLPTSLLDLMRVKNIDAAEAIHSAEHALLNRFGLPDDVKTECKAGEKEYSVTPSQRKRPARSVDLLKNLILADRRNSLIFYDAIRKGGGVAVKAFDHGLSRFSLSFNMKSTLNHVVRDLLEKAHAAIEHCHCSEGCQQCMDATNLYCHIRFLIGSPRCS
jgi:DEAD/DEAH box helicase domain-containing protein